jgi:hypothetical protein
MHNHLSHLLAASTKKGLILRNLPEPTLQAVLASAVLPFAYEQRSTEREVNEILKHWLAREGAMLATDHVELRRMLVDSGLLARDGFGHAYWRAAVPMRFAAAVQELAQHDVPRLIDDARRDRAERRRARAEAHVTRAES